MKIRSCHVSNSSSTSFILLGNILKTELPSEIIEKIYDEEEIEFHDCEDGYAIGVNPNYLDKTKPLSIIFDEVLNKINEYLEEKIQNVYFVSGESYEY